MLAEIYVLKVLKKLTIINVETHNVFISNTDLADVQIANVTRYCDLNPLDMNKIKIKFVKDDELPNNDKYNFRINSSNNQPFQFYVLFFLYILDLLSLVHPFL